MLKCPAPGTPAPHSTRRRDVRRKCLIVDGRITNLCVGADRRVRPRFDTVLTLIDVNNALARWMHRVCADLAGCYDNPISKFAVTYHRTNFRVGADRSVRPCLSTLLQFRVLLATLDRLKTCKQT